MYTGSKTTFFLFAALKDFRETNSTIKEVENTKIKEMKRQDENILLIVFGMLPKTRLT